MKPSIPRLLAMLISATLASHARAGVVIDFPGGYVVNFSGLVQVDGNWFHNDVVDLNGSSDTNDADHELELRRAYFVLGGKGTMFDWVVGYDAKAERWLDANIKWKSGSSYLTAGQFKMPNSLEGLSSTRTNDFISKAMTTNTFGLGRRMGVAYGKDNSQWGYSLSAFGRELTRGFGKGQGVGGRVYYAPFVDSGRFLHFGASLIDHDTSKDTQRWRIRPDADLATQRLLDTGNITNADRIRTAGMEAVWVNGPIKVQAEYMQSRTTRTNESAGSDFDADSWYVSGLWNLTGETWGYKGGTPTTQDANDPASGMWQVGARVDEANLNDGVIRGGKGTNVTLGVNWYWQSNAKLSLNYVSVQSSRFSAGEVVDDNPDIVEARAQFHW